MKLDILAKTPSWRQNWRFLALTLLLLSAPAVLAEPVSKSMFRGVAIGGFDPVAYHSLQENSSAVEGSKRHPVRYKGAIWRFANKSNADTFYSNPTTYQPSYNGFCSNALSEGKGLVKTNGTHWAKINDRVYLFASADGRKRWMSGNLNNFIKFADYEWARLSK